MLFALGWYFDKVNLETALLLYFVQCWSPLILCEMLSYHHYILV